MNDLNDIIKIKMEVLMFGLFKKDPVKELDKKYKTKLTEAMNAQRSGDIKSYAELSAQAESILAEMNKLQS